jgi:hypothetical protein
MPAVATTLRVLTASIVAVLLVSGCQTLDDAGRVIGRADLVNDLATRLDGSAELTYSADYRLPGGRSASISQAQQPPRAAYTYPGGKLTVTAEATTECDTTAPKAICTVNSPPSPSARPTAAIFAGASARGLVTPPVVIGLLTATALDADAVVEQRDTTIAGRHASCVKVKQVANAAASTFDACVTTEGVLGSFAGVVDGSPVEIAMSRYRDSVDRAVFDLPAGAGVIDRRPGAK